MRHISSLVSSSTCAAIALLASSAAAHIELVEPSPRYAVPANKSCPCGDGDSNRVCQTTAAESTDPNRSTNVTTFEVGSMITVVTEEYINHGGRIRVAFDPDGADLADFNENILLDVSDPDEPSVNMANPRVWRLDVPLPDEPCDSCTLQVIQVMNNDTENEVADPAPFSTYYTCADIRLVPAGSLNEGDSGAGGSANAGETGGAGAGGAAGGGEDISATGGSANAGQGGESGAAGASAVGSNAAGSGSVDDTSEDEEDSGCALRPGVAGSSSLWGLLLLGLVARRRHR